MNDRIAVVADLVQDFRLTSLSPLLSACQALASDEAPLDVAVLGQFKSGKSSLLNAVLGEAVFPVGVVPVTAVVTRAVAGPERSLHVTHLDGSIATAALEQLAEFVTEARNPGNQRRVAVVDVFLPGLGDWPGLRLVDTPGLGSVFAHNTAATRAWLPNAAVALVTVSAERPFAEEDRRLLAEARALAPRVVIVLTKVDLLTDDERREVTAFLNQALREQGTEAITVLPFSCRAQPELHVRELKEYVLMPVATDVAGGRRAALELKLTALRDACRGYLAVGLQAAERADADRAQLRAAVLNESVNVAVIRDELRLAERAASEQTRPAFEKQLLIHRGALEQRVTGALAAALRSWQGNLAEQVAHYEAWMAEYLTAELTPLSQGAAGVAADLLARAEERFRRVVEAFRDRLSRNVREATGVTVAPVHWEARRPLLDVVPVAVSRAFMTNWDLLWWLLPMRLVGGLFRRHLSGRVPWEVTKNLARLAGDWTRSVEAAVTDLRGQALGWVDNELATLDRMLGQRPAEAAGFRAALRRLEATHSP